MDLSLPNVRRSVRNPTEGWLQKRDLSKLLEKIKNNHEDTVVLKLKDHLLSDISPGVFDLIIDALQINTACQALYAQNMNAAIGDDQLKSILEVLKTKCIWCVNLGENYKISSQMWNNFCEELPKTQVTHLYVSEHVISPKLKNKMRAAIRLNRSKHDKHCSKRNIKVIEKCTNMWWNPLNSIKHKTAAREEYLASRRRSRGAEDPATTSYWAEGDGSRLHWKFDCICGEVCSYYEKHIYHPTGRMYECTSCNFWSHVRCNFGDISDDDLEQKKDALCHKCRSKLRRVKRRGTEDGMLIVSADSQA